MKTQVGVRVKVRSVSGTVAALRASVNGYEQSHHRSSESMLRSVLSGKVVDTVEIANWLTDYHVLKRLEGQYGHIPGVHAAGTEA